MARTDPAHGERRAVSGYAGQYRVAAHLTYQGIRSGQLNWIRVADPEAGRVDDLQIGIDGRVDAYQVKWSQFAGPFSYNDLTSSAAKARPDDTPKPCLIAQLADGWIRLRSFHPGQRVVVHLITNDQPSRDDRPPVAEPNPTPRHFGAFLAQAWRPARESSGLPLEAVPSRWIPAWQRLQLASGLSAEEFNRFAKDCELDFGFSISTSGMKSDFDGAAAVEDKQVIAKLLFDLAADPGNIIHLTRESLVSRLGWKDRFQLRSRHDFPSPAFVYEPVHQTRDELETKLDTIRNGYLAVLGPPGSGKSTLLTETLRSRKERKIPYYAYVPESTEPGRGEARNFLHDVVVILERLGFRVGESIPTADRGELSRRFHRQLEELHRDFSENGRRTIFLIDGLDHIDREQRPERSLLRDLPNPEQIPDGVLFLMGSQTSQLPDLPPAVDLQLQESARRVEIQSLSRDSTLRMLDRVTIPFELSAEQRARFFALTEGHPLSIGYLLNQLRSASNLSNVEAILSEEVGYGRDIQLQYHAFWRRDVEASAGLQRLLGLLACHRGGVSLDWLKPWIAEEYFQLLRDRASHYFRVQGDRWNFYHNSFRQFILERVSEKSPGVREEDRVRKLHAELAVQSAASSRIERQWEELHHLMMAGDGPSVLQRATQAYFRDQFFALRPPSLIRADIEQAFRAAADQRDVLAASRLLLAFVECADRETYLDDLSLASVLLELNDLDRALVHARDGHRLLVGVGEGLRLARKLAAKGHDEEARQLFELAEPLDLLFSAEEVEVENTRERPDTLCEWASTATLFRLTDDVLATIASMRFRNRFDRDQDPAEVTAARREMLIFQVGLGLLEQRRWDEVSVCIDLLRRPENHQNANLWLRIRLVDALCEADEDARARSALKAICAEVGAEGEDVDITIRLSVAEQCLRLQSDDEWARDCAESLAFPEVERLSVGSGSAWEYLRHAFRIGRLRFYFDDQRTIEEIVPSPDDKKLMPTVYVLRDVLRMARMVARANRREEFDRWETKNELQAIVRRFSFNPNQTPERHEWSAAFTARGDLYAHLIHVAARIGEDWVEQLREMFKIEWGSPGSSAYWNADLKRRALLAFWHSGAFREWTLSGLKALEGTMLKDEDVSGRVRACARQIDAYLEIGEHVEARRLLDEAISTAIGIGYRKDSQLDNWIDWLDAALDLEPEEQNRRVQWYANAIVSLKGTSERGYASAALKLVHVVARRDLTAAFELIIWFHGHGVLSHEDAVAILLREVLKTAPEMAELVGAVAATVLIPYSMAADSDLVADVMDALEVRGRPSLIAGARAFVDNAARFAIRAARAGWYEAARDALDNAGIESWVVPIPPGTVDSSTTEHKVNRKDASKPSAREFLDSIQSPEDLLGHLAERRESQKSSQSSNNFDCRKAIRKVMPKLDASMTRRLADALPGDYHDAFYLADLSRHARSIGALQIARELADRSLEKSSHSGWDRFYDGGSRLEALECSIEIDHVSGRQEAWRRFRDDFHDENYSRSRFIFNIRRIASILVETVPIRELYAEIEEHVNALFEGVELGVSGPDVRLEEAGLHDDGPVGVIGLLLEFHLMHAAPWVMESTWRCLGHILQTQPEVGKRLLDRLMLASEKVQERLVPVLEAIAQTDAALVAHYRDQIVALALSPHGGLRDVARRLAKTFDWTLPESHQPTTQQPPAVYFLALPPIDERQLEGINFHDDVARSLCPNESPFAIYRPEFEQISNVTEIPVANLVTRASQLMLELDPSQGWTDEAERQLRDWLEEIGPKFTFRRPKYPAGRRAIYHLLAELEDYGLASPNDLAGLCRPLRWYDPSLVLHLPAQRPTEIPEMMDERLSYGDQWLAGLDLAFSHLLERTQDGRIVLAQEVHLANPVWADRREKSLTQFAFEGVVLPESEGPFFATLTAALVRHYPRSGEGGRHPPVVLRNIPVCLEGSGGEWLALNPYVGEELGWRIAEEGWFRWEDSKGMSMVETVHWVDGPVDVSPFVDSEVGEGFMVLMSPEAAKQIVSRFGPMKRIARVTRTFRDEGTVRDNSRMRVGELNQF